MRILLYTGKGGVGKTSISAATALTAAERGYRTLVMSTDAAHSLGDSFDLPLGSEPVAVAPNLWGQEIEVFHELETRWSTIRKWLSALLQWQGVDTVVAEDMAVLPGMEELVGLLHIANYAREESYDLLIVDCAPTAETFRLLGFPEAIRWYMEHLFPIGKRANQMLGPVARTVFHLPAPTQEVLASVEGLYRQLEEMRGILANHEASSVRLVVNPEKMVVKEAQRTFTWLNLYGYATDLVVCNRVIPDTVTDPYFAAWKATQARHLSFVREAFQPVPVLTAPLLDREVVGMDALRELSGHLYAGKDPTQRFYEGQPFRVTRGKEGPVISLTLPFVERGDVSFSQTGDELVVQAGKYRRNLVLPAAVAGLEVREARREGDEVRLYFVEPAEPRATHGPRGRHA